MTRNSVADNLDTWDRRHRWERDGDEWDGMAAWCRQPYQQWKDALVRAHLLPYLGAGAHALEIAPGHGRWTETLVRAGSLTLVDLSPSCIERCRERFAAHDHISYVVGDGRTLRQVGDASADFVWSFDSFVHMQPDVVASYLQEIARVLAPGGHAVIHHAGRCHLTLPLAPMRSWGRPGRALFALISQGRLRDGWRGDVSRRLFAELAFAAGLTVVGSVQAWGDGGRYDVRRFNDWITTLRR